MRTPGDWVRKGPWFRRTKKESQRHPGPGRRTSRTGDYLNTEYGSSKIQYKEDECPSDSLGVVKTKTVTVEVEKDGGKGLIKKRKIVNSDRFYVISGH